MKRFQTKFWNQGNSKESRTWGSSVEGWQWITHKRAGALGGGEKGRAEYGEDEKYERI